MSSHRPDILLRFIFALVAKAYDVKVEDLKSKRRFAHLVWPRHVAFALAKEFSGLGYSRIAHYAGHRNHAGVAYGCRMVAEALSLDRKGQQQTEFDKLRWMIAKEMTK